MNPSNRSAVVLFHRDLRIHDHPALAAACASAQTVVPLFVVDPRLPADPNRRRFLAQSLAGLRQALRERGADLVVRHGDPVEQTIRVARETGAESVMTSADVSAYATGRQRRLRQACDAERIRLTLHPGVTVVPPGELTPTGGGDHYKVFTPYWRAWQQHRWRREADAPRTIRLPDGVTGDDPDELLRPYGDASPDVVHGGEAEARRRLTEFSRQAGGYPDGHDDLAGDRTSRLSAYLHFGCVSPLTVATSGLPEAYVRQLCWREFYHQILAAYPQLPRHAFRSGASDEWVDDADALDAWREGRTGVPLVDAGMRQLAAEGWMHNRARLVTAGYLAKTLRLDWRHGADWFDRLLVDADTANNYGNWQWVAGTGTDTKPYRRFNPVRQGQRYDPDGAYVRRWVPELADVPGRTVHEPWTLPGPQRRALAYPEPRGLDIPVAAGQTLF